MAEFFKTSVIWVVDFRFDGRPRRWFKAFGPGRDVAREMAEQLQAWYGERARLIEVRRATDDEETRYLHAEDAKTQFCPTGRP